MVEKKKKYEGFIIGLNKELYEFMRNDLCDDCKKKYLKRHINFMSERLGLNG